MGFQAEVMAGKKVQSSRPGESGEWRGSWSIRNRAGERQRDQRGGGGGPGCLSQILPLNLREMESHGDIQA